MQTFIGAQWGHVRGFALPPSKTGAPIDPGPPPIGTPADPRYKEQAVAVIRASAALDPSDGEMIDISPAGFGNNPLGTNDGHGYAVNPVTGQPYTPELVRRGDYARVLAEFWADGPNSETPPGHWNVLANVVSDSPQLAGRIGPGAANRLKWDVEMYFALNGAVHDAAIAAWGLKRKYQSVRPISMIRYMAGQGQSSDPQLPSYNREGLPLIPGLIELITPESSAPGQRHAALADHVGEIAIRTWRGNPKTPSEQSGVGWILGETLGPVPEGDVRHARLPRVHLRSQHVQPVCRRGARRVHREASTSPAASTATRSRPATSRSSAGRARRSRLRWATYYDAADQAGVSRIFGGIHIPADDFAGRRIGSRIGKAAFALAERYFKGTAPK